MNCSFCCLHTWKGLCVELKFELLVASGMLLCRNAWCITLCICVSRFERIVAVKICFHPDTVYTLTELDSIVIW